MARNRPNILNKKNKYGNKGKMPQYNLKFGPEADEEDVLHVSEKVSVVLLIL